MNEQNQNNTIDVNEPDQAPPSFEESQRRDRQNDGIVPASQQTEPQHSQQPRQGGFVAKTETPDYSHSATRQPRPNNTNGDAIPPGEVQYVTPLENLQNTPQWIDCPFCKKRTLTRVSYDDSTATTIAGGVCCLFGIIFTCVPCLCGWFQDTNHFCTECRSRVTHRPHDGPVQVQMPRPIGQQVSAYAYPQGQPQMQYQPQGVQQQGSSVPSNNPPAQGELPNGGHQAVSSGVPTQGQAQNGSQRQQESPGQASMYQSGGQAAPEPAKLS